MLRTPKGTRPEMTSLCTIGRLSQWTSERTTAPYILRDPQQQPNVGVVQTINFYYDPRKSSYESTCRNSEHTNKHLYILYIFLAYHTT